MSVDEKIEFIEKTENSNKNTKAYQLIDKLFDNGTFTEIDSLAKSSDNCGQLICGFGYIEGKLVYTFAQNVQVDSGVVSKVNLDKMLDIYKLAIKTGNPVVGIYDSMGSNLNEGNELLKSYGEILKISNNISGVVPCISVVVGPCLGMNAMLASSADFVVMTKEAKLSVDITGESSSLCDAQNNGVCHVAASDNTKAIEDVRRLISILPSNNLSESSLNFLIEKNESKITKESKIRDILDCVCDRNSFFEIQQTFGQAFIVGFSKINGKTIGVVASDKEYNCGNIDSDSCTKTSRFIRFCDAFSIPIVTFANSEKFVSLKDSVKLLNSYAEATTPKITLIIGNVYGPFYVSVAGAGSGTDVVLAWPNASISALEAKTAVAIMHNDNLKNVSDPINERKKLIDDYINIESSALKAASKGFINNIVKLENTRESIVAYLDMLLGKRVFKLPKKHSNIQM